MKLLLVVAAAGGVAALVKQRLISPGSTAPPAAEPFMRPSPQTSSSVTESAIRTPSVRPADDQGIEADSAEVEEVAEISEAEVAEIEVAEVEVAEVEVAEVESAADVEEASPEQPATVSPAASTTVELDLEQIAAEREAVTPADPVAEIISDQARSGPPEPGPSRSGLPPLPQPPHGPFTTVPVGPADDLGRISGVGPKLQRLLNEQGITQLSQIASLTDAEVDVLQSRIVQFPGRIRRDRWVEQARRLTTNR